MDPETFLTEVVALQSAGKLDDAIDQVYDTVDDLLCGGKFAEVDVILDAVDVARLDVSVLLSILTAAGWEKERLRSRMALYERVETHLLKTRTPENVAALLQGLR